MTFHLENFATFTFDVADMLTFYLRHLRTFSQV